MVPARAAMIGPVVCPPGPFGRELWEWPPSCRTGIVARFARCSLQHCSSYPQTWTKEDVRTLGYCAEIKRDTGSDVKASKETWVTLGERSEEG
jgi:hypothetical protein